MVKRLRQTVTPIGGGGKAKTTKFICKQSDSKTHSGYTEAPGKIRKTRGEYSRRRWAGICRIEQNAKKRKWYLENLTGVDSKGDLRREAVDIKSTKYLLT